MIVLNLERTRAAVWFAFDKPSLATAEPILLGIIRVYSTPGASAHPRAALAEARKTWGRHVTVVSPAEIAQALGATVSPDEESS